MKTIKSLEDAIRHNQPGIMKGWLSSTTICPDIVYLAAEHLAFKDFITIFEKCVAEKRLSGTELLLHLAYQNDFDYSGLVSYLEANPYTFSDATNIGIFKACEEDLVYFIENRDELLKQNDYGLTPYGASVLVGTNRALEHCLDLVSGDDELIIVDTSQVLMTPVVKENVVIHLLVNLANVIQEQEDVKAALALYRRAIQIAEPVYLIKKLEVYQHYLYMALRCAGECCVKQDMLEEAAEYFKQSLIHFEGLELTPEEKNIGSLVESFISICLRLAKRYLDMKDFVNAAEYYRRAYNMGVKLTTPDKTWPERLATMATSYGNLHKLCPEIGPLVDNAVMKSIEMSSSSDEEDELFERLDAIWVHYDECDDKKTVLAFSILDNYVNQLLEIPVMYWDIIEYERLIFACHESPLFIRKDNCLDVLSEIYEHALELFNEEETKKNAEDLIDRLYDFVIALRVIERLSKEEYLLLINVCYAQLNFKINKNETGLEPFDEFADIISEFRALYRDAHAIELYEQYQFRINALKGQLLYQKHSKFNEQILKCVFQSAKSAGKIINTLQSDYDYELYANLLLLVSRHYIQINNNKKALDTLEKSESILSSLSIEKANSASKKMILDMLKEVRALTQQCRDKTTFAKKPKRRKRAVPKQSNIQPVRRNQTAGKLSNDAKRRQIVESFNLLADKIGLIKISSTAQKKQAKEQYFEQAAAFAQKCTTNPDKLVQYWYVNAAGKNIRNQLKLKMLKFSPKLAKDSHLQEDCRGGIGYLSLSLDDRFVGQLYSLCTNNKFITESEAIIVNLQSVPRGRQQKDAANSKKLTRQATAKLEKFLSQIALGGTLSAENQVTEQTWTAWIDYQPLFAPTSNRYAIKHKDTAYAADEKCFALLIKKLEALNCAASFDDNHILKIQITAQTCTESSRWESELVVPFIKYVEELPLLELLEIQTVLQGLDPESRNSSEPEQVMSIVDLSVDGCSAFSNKALSTFARCGFEWMQYPKETQQELISSPRLPAFRALTD